MTNIEITNAYVELVSFLIGGVMLGFLIGLGVAA